MAKCGPLLSPSRVSSLNLIDGDQGTGDNTTIVQNMMSSSSFEHGTVNNNSKFQANYNYELQTTQFGNRPPGQSRLQPRVATEPSNAGRRRLPIFSILNCLLSKYLAYRFRGPAQRAFRPAPQPPQKQHQHQPNKASTNRGAKGSAVLRAENTFAGIPHCASCNQVIRYFRSAHSDRLDRTRTECRCV